MTRRSPAVVTRALAGALVVAAPVSLVDPERFYADLLRPSLILLWLAQLAVVLAFRVYVVRAERRQHVNLPRPSDVSQVTVLGATRLGPRAAPRVAVL